MARKNKSQLEKIQIKPDYFLNEAKSFLESYEKDQKNFINLTNCVIYLHIALELTIKDTLTKIHPSLILDQNYNAYSFAYVCKLEKKIKTRPAKEIEFKTASFPILIERASPFMGLDDNTRRDLTKFYKVRNNIVHLGYLDIEPNNLGILIFDKILPLIERFNKKRETRVIPKPALVKLKTIIEKSLIKEITSEIKEARKEYRKLSPEVIQQRKFTSQALENETTEASGLYCPSCSNDSFSIYLGVDFDWNPDGILSNAYYMGRCSICKLILDEYQMEEIAKNGTVFFKDTSESWDISEIKNDYRDESYKVRRNKYYSNL